MPHHTEQREMTMTQPFTLSIEPTEGKSFQYSFHLGTDECLARQIAEEKFHARNHAGMFTRAVALMWRGKVVDVFDGEWTSDCVVEAEI